MRASDVAANPNSDAHHKAMYPIGSPVINPVFALRLSAAIFPMPELGGKADMVRDGRHPVETAHHLGTIEMVRSTTMKTPLVVGSTAPSWVFATFSRGGVDHQLPSTHQTLDNASYRQLEPDGATLIFPFTHGTGGAFGPRRHDNKTPVLGNGAGVFFR